MLVKRALLAYAGPKDGRLRYKLNEFRSLAEVAGYDVVGEIAQFRDSDTRYYLGLGKVQEAKNVVQSGKVDVLIAYHPLRPIQVFNLRNELGVEVMDRVQLILRIFESRAGSLEAKLQIELARLRYELPRVREYVRRIKMGEQIGFLGAGEYAVESYYRHMRARVVRIRRRLDEIRARRARLVERRYEVGIPEVVLTGYTSAGKTTLFNRLTNESKLVDGKPFATLDTYSRVINLWGKRIVLTDTIGFIDDLPPLLIESFYSTLEDVVRAHVIVLVVDGSDPLEELKRKVNTAFNTFLELGITGKPMILVLNKIDIAHDIEEKLMVLRSIGENVLAVSALTGRGISELKELTFKVVPGYKVIWAEGTYCCPDGVTGVLRNGNFVGMVTPMRDVDKVVGYLREKGVEFVIE